MAYAQHAVQTGEATEKSQPFLQMIQTTNLAAGDFLKFYSTSYETRTGDFYNEIQHNEEQGIGIADLQASQITRSKLQVQTGSFESYIDAALYIVDIWAMNKLQSQALLQPFEFLQRYKTGEYEQEEPQYFNYIGSAGGTGKSRVIDGFRDVFRLKDCEKGILITTSSGSAAAKILGVTVHSALGIGINDKKVNGTAALQWAPKYRKHMSIFLSMHEWIRTKKSSFTLDGTSRTEKITVSPTVDMITDALSIPDDSKIKIPPLYIHIPGTPVMTTENEHPGLKHVNEAEFTSVAVIPDARYPGYAISEGITIHFGPPAGLLVTSEDIKDIQVPGLDRGTILIAPKQTQDFLSNPSRYTKPTKQDAIVKSVNGISFSRKGPPGYADMNIEY
ncbi:hypothetical protein V8E54_008690 [Elaphomyces granulatus]